MMVFTMGLPFNFHDLMVTSSIIFCPFSYKRADIFLEYAREKAYSLRDSNHINLNQSCPNFSLRFKHTLKFDDSLSEQKPSLPLSTETTAYLAV